MQTSELLAERFFNAFKHEDKQKYAQEIWDMLQKSYKSIGGIKGTGFSSIEDMIDNNYMFKVGLRNSQPVMVAIYKNRDGVRKLVAIATNGTRDGIKMARTLIKDELLTGRSFAEISGPALATMKKVLPEDVLLSLLIPADKVGKLLNKKVIIGPGDDIVQQPNDPYAPYYYHRKIGDSIYTKLAFGDPVKTSRFD